MNLLMKLTSVTSMTSLCSSLILHVHSETTPALHVYTHQLDERWYPRLEGLDSVPR